MGWEVDCVDLEWYAVVAAVTDWVNDARRMGNLVESKLFKAVWEEANIADRSHMLKLLKARHLVTLRDWCHKHEAIPLEHKSYHHLCMIASKLGIKNYNRYGKDILVQRIRNEQQQQQQKQQQQATPPPLSNV